MIFGGNLAALFDLEHISFVEIKCVTTIYLPSLLFLCHCDLDFDVKEAEKSTLINSLIKTGYPPDNAIYNEAYYMSLS